MQVERGSTDLPDSEVFTPAVISNVITTWKLKWKWNDAIIEKNLNTLNKYYFDKNIDITVTLIFLLLVAYGLIVFDNIL